MTKTICDVCLRETTVNTLIITQYGSGHEQENIYSKPPPCKNIDICEECRETGCTNVEVLLRAMRTFRYKPWSHINKPVS